MVGGFCRSFTGDGGEEMNRAVFRGAHINGAIREAVVTRFVCGDDVIEIKTFE